MAGGCKNSCDAFAVSDFAIPHYFAGTVVKRAKRRIGPEVAVAASPAFRLPCGCPVKNAEDSACIHIEEARLRIEAGRHPIGRAVGTGLDQRAVRAGSGFRLSDRAAAGVNAGSPRLVDERSCDQMLAIRSIEQKEK